MSFLRGVAFLKWGEAASTSLAGGYLNKGGSFLREGGFSKGEAFLKGGREVKVGGLLV